MPTTIDGTTGVSLIQTTAAPFLVGQVCLFAMNAAPSGFLKCNGAAVSRTTYSALFAAIGTTYGAGNGTTTFNVPDLRGEFLRGLDDGRGIDTGRAIGSAQGQALRQSTLTNIVRQQAATAAGTNDFSYSELGNAGYATGVVGGHGTITLGSGTETRPRNVALLSCIFTGVA